MTMSETEDITPNPTMESTLDCEANGDGTAPSQEQEQGNSISFDSEVVQYNNADWSIDRRSTIRAQMKSKKKEDRFPLQEDVYAFITAAPIISVPFMFSCVVILLKFIVYGILASDIKIKDFDNESVKTTICKFLLVPVAIAMQEDLIDAYWFYANVRYCPQMKGLISKSATKAKLQFSYFLRTIDGGFSLGINIAVMLTTSTTLDMFLNFAALQFLQSIDDVFYELVCLGFFGDNMEHMSVVCRKITLIRRHGEDNSREMKYFRISHLDSLLFLITIIVCIILVAVNTYFSYKERGDGAGAPTLSPTALNFTDPQS